MKITQTVTVATNPIYTIVVTEDGEPEAPFGVTAGSLSTSVRENVIACASGNSPAVAAEKIVQVMENRILMLRKEFVRQGLRVA